MVGLYRQWLWVGYRWFCSASVAEVADGAGGLVGGDQGLAGGGGVELEDQVVEGRELSFHGVEAVSQLGGEGFAGGDVLLGSRDDGGVVVDLFGQIGHGGGRYAVGGGGGGLRAAYHGLGRVAGLAGLFQQLLVAQVPPAADRQVRLSRLRFISLCFAREPFNRREAATRNTVT